MNIVDQEPPIVLSVLLGLFWDLRGGVLRKFGRKLSFGEMFLLFEDQARLEGILRRKGFTFTWS